MTRSARLALLVLPLAVAACGAPTQPAALRVAAAEAPIMAAAAPVAAAKAVPAPVPQALAPDATSARALVGAAATETALPAPTDAYFYWEWRKNVYSWLGAYDASATLAFRVPADARITGVHVYFGTERVADLPNPTPGGIATVPAPRGDVKYHLATYDAAGRESTRVGPLERPAEPKRYGAPTVTARGTRSLTIAWTTDLPGVGYLRYSKDPKWGAWHETPIETRINGFHSATLTGLSPFSRYTIVAFSRINGEDVEVGRAHRWTKPFSIFGSEPSETEAAMNAD